MSTLGGTRLAILVQNLPVPFDRRVWQEATALAAAGAHVTVICPGDARHPAGRFDIDGVVVRRYKPALEASGLVGYVSEYWTSLSRMARALRDERRRGPFSIVHFCNPPDLLYIIAKRLQRRDGATLVFDQHDLGPELVHAKKMRLSWLLTAVATHFERRTYRAADHVIATNESYRSIAQRRGGFSANEVTIVRSGPPANWADFEPSMERDWHGGHRYLLGYVGVMGKQEGLDYLISALGLLVKDHRLDVGLALVSGGPERQQLERLVEEQGLQERVTFYGRVPDDALKAILADADVCVNPDEVNPMNDLSTMNKIVEYMALGRPIVQFDVKEGRFSAGDASAYAKANDARDLARKIAELLEDPERRAAMSKAGRERFRNVLCWERQAEVLVGLYDELRGGS